MLGLRIITGLFLGIWLLLVLFGKSGFVHLLLLSGIGFGVVAWACFYRGRVRAEASADSVEQSKSSL